MRRETLAGRQGHLGPHGARVRRRELRERHARFEQEDLRWSEGVEALCRHHHGYPRWLALAGDRAPRMLYVSGTTQRLVELGAQPTVAIVGTRRATDYGMEMARSLARGLAASGVTVVGALADGIAVAALHRCVLCEDGRSGKAEQLRLREELLDGRVCLAKL